MFVRMRFTAIFIKYLWDANLRRRIEILLIKAHEIKDYGVDVAIIFKRNDNYTYRSTNGPAWPPSMATLVGNTVTRQQLFPQGMANRDRKIHTLSPNTYYQEISIK